MGTELLFGDYDASRSGRSSRIGGTVEASSSAIKVAPPPPPPYPCAELCFPEEVCDDDALGAEGGGGFKMEAAIPAQAAQAAQAAPAPQADRAKKSRIASAAAPPSGTARGGFGGQAEMAPEGVVRVETSLTVDETAKHFQSLRLLDISSPQRGRLTALEQVEEYRQSVSITWSRFEIATALQKAHMAASRIDGAGPPPGHSYPKTQGGFDFSYPAQAPVDLVSDGAFHSVPVFVIDLQPTVHYVCTPRESLLVFRTASMANGAGRGLPEGPADMAEAERAATRLATVQECFDELAVQWAREMSLDSSFAKADRDRWLADWEALKQRLGQISESYAQADIHWRQQRALLDDLSAQLEQLPKRKLEPSHSAT